MRKRRNDHSDQLQGDYSKINRCSVPTPPNNINDTICSDPYKQIFTFLSSLKAQDLYSPLTSTRYRVCHDGTTGAPIILKKSDNLVDSLKTMW